MKKENASEFPDVVRALVSDEIGEFMNVRIVDAYLFLETYIHKNEPDRAQVDDQLKFIKESFDFFDSKAGFTKLDLASYMLLYAARFMKEIYDKEDLGEI